MKAKEEQTSESEGGFFNNIGSFFKRVDQKMEGNSSGPDGH